MSEAPDIAPCAFSAAGPSWWQSGAFRCNQQDKSQAEAESGANASRSENRIGSNLATVRIRLYYLSLPLELHILNCRPNEWSKSIRSQSTSLIGRRHTISPMEACLTASKAVFKIASRKIGRAPT